MRAVVLDDLIHRNGISMEMKKVRSNPILPGEYTADGVEHFQFRLLRPGREVDVYLSVDSAEMEDDPTVSDVMLMLAMDASGCKMLEGYEACNEELASVFGGSDGNLREMEGFWQEYRARRRQAEEVKRFLGDMVYEELLYHFMI